MDEVELHEEIVRLEAEIEQHAATIESCRKLILGSKLAAAAAAVALLAALLGVITLEPAIMIGALGVLLGAIVVFGSNTSTLDQAVNASKAAELERSQLIGQMQLRVVGSPTLH